jgi:hypothetical protein
MILLQQKFILQSSIFNLQSSTCPDPRPLTPFFFGTAKQSSSKSIEKSFPQAPAGDRG